MPLVVALLVVWGLLALMLLILNIRSQELTRRTQVRIVLHVSPTREEPPP